MIMRKFFESFLKKLKERIVEIIVTLILSGIGLIATSYTPIKNELGQHPNVLLVLLAIMAPLTALCLTLMIRVYWQYGRFHEEYGVFWDKNHNMRCLSCKKPLKNSSMGPSTFFCSDPKCNSKHVLRDSNGIETTRQGALLRLAPLAAIKGIRSTKIKCNEKCKG